jgi:hypothetical protein
VITGTYKKTQTYLKLDFRLQIKTVIQETQLFFNFLINKNFVYQSHYHHHIITALKKIGGTAIADTVQYCTSHSHANKFIQKKLLG